MHRLRTGAVICLILASWTLAFGQSNTPPWVRVNQNAAGLTSGDQAMTSAATDEIFQALGVPENLSITIRDRLVRAQLGYLNGNHSAIDEKDIVRAVNHVAKQFNSPAYGYCDSSDVRKVRLRLVITHPKFLGGIHRTSDELLGNRLQPVEAFYVAGTVIRQKLMNPEFQVTSSERIKHWAELHRRGSPNSGQQSKPDFTSGRLDESAQVVARGIANRTQSDADALTNQFLTILGIAH